jgi:hypothetical protein
MEQADVIRRTKANGSSLFTLRGKERVAFTTIIEATSDSPGRCALFIDSRLAMIRERH